MNIKTIYKATAAMTISALSLTSCVKDGLFDTPHPDHGKISITADWSSRGPGIDIPDRWNVALGDYRGEETETTHAPDRLFEEGNYMLLAWNDARHIHIDGETATAIYPDTDSDTMTGWFFTHVQRVTIEHDCEHDFTAPMMQQVRQLAIVITPTGDTAGRISSIDATLSGVCGKLNFVTNIHSTPVTVPLKFSKSSDGRQWVAVIRVLGIAGESQQLRGYINFSGGNPQAMPVDSDLSVALRHFNSNKTIPLTLGGSVTETPAQSDMTATITDWQQLDDWNIDAF